MSNWNTVQFSDIADFKNGLNFKSGETGHALKVLGVGDFQNRTFLDQVDEISTIHTEKEIDSSYHLQDGDLVFVRSNGNKALVGRCMLVRNTKEKISFSGFTIRARLTASDVLPAFVNLLMQAGVLRKELKRDGRGTNISNLNQGMLSKIEIPLISIDQQREILDFFGNWNKAIEKTEALIDAKERQFGWLLYELIGSKKATKNLGDVCSLEKEIRFDKNKEDLPYLEIGDVDTKTKTYNIRNKDKKAVSGAVKVPQNTLLISTVRPTRGAVTKTHSQIYVSSAFCRLKIENDFYFYCVQQEKFFNYLKARQSGATYPTVKDRDILTFKVPVIEKEEQLRTIQILDTARHEIDLLIKLADQYRTQKRGLMQKLLSGE